MKKALDLLAIILPALIIALGFLRLFVNKTRGVNGLTMFFAIVLLLVGLVRYYVFPDSGNSGNSGPKPPPLTVSKHSAAFNESLEKVLNAYYKLTAAFTAADTALISGTASSTRSALDSLQLAELKVDSLIYETAIQPYETAKAELLSITADPSLAEKRGSFDIFSRELFSLLSITRYDLAKIYWQECENAFGEGKPGNWLSRTEQSESPYAPKNCAEVKTTLNFVPADSSLQKTSQEEPVSKG